MSGPSFALPEFSADDATVPPTEARARRAEVVEGERRILGWIARQTAHHPSGRAAYDGMIDQLGVEMSRRHDEADEAALDDLVKIRVKAVAAARNAVGAYRDAARARRAALHAWEQARMRLGLPLPPQEPRDDVDPFADLPAIETGARRPRGHPSGDAPAAGTTSQDEAGGDHADGADHPRTDEEGTQ